MSPIDGPSDGRAPEAGRAIDELAATFRSIANAGDLDELRRRVVHCACRLLHADGATFVLRDGDECHYLDEEAIAPLWKGSRFPMRACISGWAMLNRAVARVEDVARDDRIPWEVYEPTFVKSLIMAPMRQADPVGALGIYWSRPHRATEEEVALLQCVADVAAGVLGNLQLIEELARKERLYRSVVEDQTEMIVRWQPGGVRTFANGAYRRTFEGLVDEFIGTSFWPLVSREDRDAVEAKIGGLTPERPQATDVHKMIGRDGRVSWQEWTDRAIFDASGSLSEYQSVGRDVTERVRLEEQLARVRAQEAMATLATGVAHDLNNLLMPIIWNLERLGRSLSDRDDVLEVVRELDATAQAAGDLLRRMLVFARQQQDQERIPIDLSETVEGHLPVLRSVLGTGVRLAFEPRRVPPVLANEGLVGQILLNLAGNARDARPNDEFTIAIDVVPGADGGDRVRLSCSDRGPGMEPEVAARAFDPYFTTKGEAGTGLGLATVYAIARDLGGDARLHTAPGRGTTVEILLPVATGPGVPGGDG